MTLLRDALSTLSSARSPTELRAASARLDRALEEATQVGAEEEVEQLRDLAASPELLRMLTPEARANLQSLLQGASSERGPVRAGRLAFDLSLIADAGRVSERFAVDFAAVRAQLLDERLNPSARAERAMEFLARYLERFVQLASTPVSAGATGTPAPAEPGAGSGSSAAGESRRADDDASDYLPRARGNAGRGGAASGRSKAGSAASQAQALAQKAADDAHEQAPTMENFLGDGITFQRSEPEPEGDLRRALSQEEQRREARRFAQVMTTAGLSKLKEPRTGLPVPEVGAELLLAESPQELQRWGRELGLPGFSRGASTEGTQPPPEALAARVAERASRFQQPATGENLAPLPVPPADLRSPQLPPPVSPGTPERLARDAAVTDAGVYARGTNKRLGRNMLWNVLHRFRKDEDQALQDEKWDRVVVGALLALLSVALVVAVLVNL